MKTSTSSVFVIVAALLSTNSFAKADNPVHLNRTVGASCVGVSKITDLKTGQETASEVILKLKTEYLDNGPVDISFEGGYLLKGEIKEGSIFFEDNTFGFEGAGSITKVEPDRADPDRKLYAELKTETKRKGKVVATSVSLLKCLLSQKP